MREMKGWERKLFLSGILVLTVILLSISSRLMEDRMDFELGLRYSFLLGYFALGGWIALRKGKKLGMVRRRVTNRPLAILAWLIGLSVLLSLVTPRIG